MQTLIIIFVLAVFMYAFIAGLKEEKMGEYPSKATKIGESIMLIMLMFIGLYIIVSIVKGIMNVGS